MLCFAILCVMPITEIHTVVVIFLAVFSSDFQLTLCQQQTVLLLWPNDLIAEFANVISMAL